MGQTKYTDSTCALIQIKFDAIHMLRLMDRLFHRSGRSLKKLFALLYLRR